MPSRQGGTQGSPGVSRSGLDPKLLKRSLLQDPTIGHAIQGHPTGQTQVGGAGLLVGAAHQSQ